MRKILSWEVSEKLSGVIRLESLKRAIDHQFLQKKDLKNNTQNLDLMVDGGSENNNVLIHEFIKIGLKDVLFFNSLMEGNNKILKQTYLKDKEQSSEQIAHPIFGIKNDVFMC